MSTNTIKAIIVDDELNSRTLLKSMLERYCEQVEVAGLAESVNSAYDLVQKEDPQLIFLDIEMPRGSGFELLKRIQNPNFEVVFVTGFDHYALKAIKVHALDYLLKPVDIDELIEAVEKVEKRQKEKMQSDDFQNFLTHIQHPTVQIDHIAIPTNNGKEFIPVEQIMYCQADGPCTWIYLENRRLYSSKNLGEYEKLLPEPNGTLKHRFYRVHHGYLINFHFAKKYNRHESHIEMINGSKIPVSQRRKAKYLHFLKKHNLG